MSGQGDKDEQELIQQLNDAGVLAEWLEDDAMRLSFASGRTFEILISMGELHAKEVV